MWGGKKGAPVFIKAGELFKDGEVDLVTLDKSKLAAIFKQTTEAMTDPLRSNYSGRNYTPI